MSNGEQIHAPVLYASSKAATNWCVNALGQRYPIIHLAARLTFPNPSEKVRQDVLNKLREYNMDTAGRLILQTIGVWSRRRTNALHTQKEYRSLPLAALGGETRHYFGHTIKDANLLASTPRSSSGARMLTPQQIEREAEAWARQLTRTPFYETIYSFSLAVIDWLQTCDLSQFEEKTEQAALDVALWNFQIMLGLD